MPSWNKNPAYKLSDPHPGLIFMGSVVEDDEKYQTLRLIDLYFQVRDTENVSLFARYDPAHDVEPLVNLKNGESAHLEYTPLTREAINRFHAWARDQQGMTI
jgi:hypothetical protein